MHDRHMSALPAGRLLFSLDAESNGLYGAVWAIGAVVLDGQAEVARFAGMVDPGVHVTEPWVQQHVVLVVDLPPYADKLALLDAFWRFWLAHRETALCLADFGVPVEAQLFRECVEQDPTRAHEAPYPLHELGTALLLAGVDPDVDRRAFCGRPDLVPHNPVDDALAAGLCWQRAMAMIAGASPP